MYVYMYVYNVYIRMYIYIYFIIYVYDTYIYMDRCTYMCILKKLYLCADVHADRYVCVSLSPYICIYIYIHIYTLLIYRCIHTRKFKSQVRVGTWTRSEAHSGQGGRSVNLCLLQRSLVCLLFQDKHGVVSLMIRARSFVQANACT